MNDFEVLRTLSIGGMRPLTAEREAAWFDRVTANDSEVTFTLYERETLRPIGNLGLHQIDHYNRTASFGISTHAPHEWRPVADAGR